MNYLEFTPSPKKRSFNKDYVNGGRVHVITMPEILKQIPGKVRDPVGEDQLFSLATYELAFVKIHGIHIFAVHTSASLKTDVNSSKNQ